MKTKFKDIYINYEVLGEKGPWIVFLHGWGGSTESFKIVAESFDANRCLLLDFPPFGESEEPYEVWNNDTYVALVKHILDELKIKTCDIIAHSFGGRVAIKFANRYNESVKKIILVDSAGVKPRFSLKKFIRIKRYKLAKKFRLKTRDYSSSDYKKLSPLMKQTFTNIINEDLSPLLKNIACPTLIIFGKDDKETPLYMAKKLNKKIKDSALIVFENCGHFAYLEDFYRFVAISKSFLKG